MTPEQSLAIMKMKAKAAEPKVPTTTGMPDDPASAAPVAPPEAPEPSWSQALTEMMKNSQMSDWKEQFVDPLLHPVDTLNSIGGMADAFGERYIPGMKSLNEFATKHGATSPPSDEKKAEYDQMLTGLSQHFGDYTTREGMKKNVAKGIPSMFADATLFAPGAAGLANRVAKGPGKVEKTLRKNPNAEAEFNAMDPETRILADSGGKETRDLIRSVTKESGEAADAMDAATTPRSLKYDKVLEDKVAKIRDDSRPERYKAYDDAYKEGGDIPYTQTNKGDHVPEPFKDLLSGGVARDAYLEAVPKVDDFRRHSNSNGGPLAEIDMTQRILSDAAKAEEIRAAQGIKGSSLTTAKQYRDAAASLKNKADEIMGTPTYAKARELGEKNFKDIEEATTKHGLEVAKQEGTRKAVSKALPTEGISLTEIMTSLPAVFGLGSVGFMGAPGAAAAAISGIPALIAMGSRLKKRGLKKHGFDIGKMLTSKEFPTSARRNLMDAIQEKSKYVRRGTAPGVITRDGKEK